MKICVYQVNGMGDFIAVLPLLRGLKEHPAVDSLLLITSHVGAELVEPLGLVDDILCFQLDDYLALSRRPVALWKTAGRIRQWGPDLSFSMDDECAASAFLAFLSRTRLRVGFDRVRNRGSRLYNRLLPFDFHQHVIHNRWKCLEWLGEWTESRPSAAPQPVPLSVTQVAVDGVEYLRKQTGCSRMISLHPYAKYDYKCWPAERYQQLIERLLTGFPDAAVIVIADQHEEDWSRDNRRVHVVSGSTLAELIGLISMSCLFIGNNSGPMNVAQNQGIPTICINGPSGAWWFDAWNRPTTLMLTPTSKCRTCDEWSSRRGVCVHSEYIECLKSISVDEVIHAVYQVMEHAQEKVNK